jgi:hypothetical protein
MGQLIYYIRDTVLSQSQASTWHVLGLLSYFNQCWQQQQLQQLRQQGYWSSAVTTGMQLKQFQIQNYAICINTACLPEPQ